MSRELTAGEECQLAAKTFSAFVDQNKGAAIPPNYIVNAMGLAICRGGKGVAVLRLKNGEWSAPCAIELEHQGGTIQPGQETVLLFMTENVILKLVARALLRLGMTDQFKPGPLHRTEPINPAIDVYGWVRFNGGFTPPELIAQNMVAWFVREDPPRHARWHGENVTWFDVLTNKITVDRSSVGNALYVVLNLAAGSSSAIDPNRKNWANVDSLTGIAPSVTNSKQFNKAPSQSGGQPSAGGSGMTSPAAAGNDYHQQLYQQQQAQIYQQQLLQQQQLYQQQLQQQQQQLAAMQALQQPQLAYGLPNQQVGMYNAMAAQQLSYEQALQQQYAQQMQQQQSQSHQNNQGGYPQGMNPSQWNQ